MGGDFRMLNQVKINNGVYIDDKEVRGVTDVQLDSSIDNISELTITMLCIVDGLDNINKNQFSFETEKPKKEYKPSRKYLSR